MNHQWPTSIKNGDVLLKPLRFRDKNEWDSIRRVNREWLTPWEATRPLIDSDRPLPTFLGMVRQANRDGRDLRALNFGIWLHEGADSAHRLVGQITLGGIVLGAYRGGHIGYWVDSRYANRGITTAAVVALTEYAFSALELHRIEINMRPENSASKRVAEKAGFTFEGVRNKFLHIDGDWRDHLTFVIENPSM